MSFGKVLSAPKYSDEVIWHDGRKQIWRYTGKTWKQLEETTFKQPNNINYLFQFSLQLFLSLHYLWCCVCAAYSIYINRILFVRVQKQNQFPNQKQNKPSKSSF